MHIDPAKDDKLNTLKTLLKSDKRVKNKKIILFTEYRSTALYIERELKKDGLTDMFELDGQSKVDRSHVIKRFAPYYNGKNSKNIAEIGPEIQLLIATDVLAEGLNLQDATCLINYELHWNPVRLMQRIGRVDRRRNREIEEALLADHPQDISERNTIYFWNFLPPAELESLLALYQRVSQKTLRISKTLGIEGKKLLTPEDDYNSLQEFNAAYEGSASEEEIMALDYQRLILEDPDFIEHVNSFPQKIFSGKDSIINKGFFFCYELPVKYPNGDWAKNGDGFYKWYFLDPSNGDISEKAYSIWQMIKSENDTPRVLSVQNDDFAAVKKQIDAYISKSYMKAIQAPIGVKPRLSAWMQLV
jgi:hypothetical protein